MPKEYKDCVTAVMQSGKSSTSAHAICAAQFYKKHGKTPREAAHEGKSSEFSLEEEQIFDLIDAIGPIFVQRLLDESETKTELISNEAAVWTTKYVNDLPDSCFLYVESGEKDDGGKTVPRGKRHFPYKDSGGKVDLPHLRNAIARAPQANVPPAVKARVQARARALLAKHGGNPQE